MKELVISAYNFCLDWDATVVDTELNTKNHIGNFNYFEVPEKIQDICNEYDIKNVHLFGYKEYLKGIIDNCKSTTKYEIDVNYYINE